MKTDVHIDFEKFNLCLFLGFLRELCVLRG